MSDGVSKIVLHWLAKRPRLLGFVAAALTIAIVWRAFEPPVFKWLHALHVDACWNDTWTPLPCPTSETLLKEKDRKLSPDGLREAIDGGDLKAVARYFDTTIPLDPDQLHSMLSDHHRINPEMLRLLGRRVREADKQFCRSREVLPGSGPHTRRDGVERFVVYAEDAAGADFIRNACNLAELRGLLNEHLRTLTELNDRAAKHNAAAVEKEAFCNKALGSNTGSDLGPKNGAKWRFDEARAECRSPLIRGTLEQDFCRHLSEQPQKYYPWDVRVKGYCRDANRLLPMSRDNELRVRRALDSYGFK